MLKRMPATVFIDWMNYDAMEPFGPWRLDWLFAEVCTMIANVNRDPKRKPMPWKTTDFLVKFGEQTKDDLAPKKSVAEQIAIAKMIVGSFNAVEKK